MIQREASLKGGEPSIVLTYAIELSIAEITIARILRPEARSRGLLSLLLRTLFGFRDQLSVLSKLPKIHTIKQTPPLAPLESTVHNIHRAGVVTTAMSEVASQKSVSLAGTTLSNGTKRKRTAEPKFYAVRVGYQPGIYHTWADCLEQVKGFKKALCKKLMLVLLLQLWLNRSNLVKSFPTLTDAERFLAGENPSQTSTTAASPIGKFYAVKSGRIPGIYTDWPSAQEQITGWQKPKHRSFATRAEAQRFLDDDGHRTNESPDATEVESSLSLAHRTAIEPTEIEVKPPPAKKSKKAPNSSAKGAKLAATEFSEEDYEPGTGPLPPGTEDGFDPNIMLDPVTGNLVYKTIEQRQATKRHPSYSSQMGTLRIHTDGSSLGNGSANAFAGVGVYFGPGDER